MTRWFNSPGGRQTTSDLDALACHGQITAGHQVLEDAADHFPRRTDAAGHFLLCKCAASTYRFAHEGEYEIRATFQELVKLFDPHVGKVRGISVITDTEREPDPGNNKQLFQRNHPKIRFSPIPFNFRFSSFIFIPRLHSFLHPPDFPL